jgi:hypothetical protein
MATHTYKETKLSRQRVLFCPQSTHDFSDVRKEQQRRQAEYLQRLSARRELAGLLAEKDLVTTPDGRRGKIVFLNSRIGTADVRIEGTHAITSYAVNVLRLVEKAA